MFNGFNVCFVLLLIVINIVCVITPIISQWSSVKYKSSNKKKNVLNGTIEGK